MVITTLLLLGLEKLKYGFTARRIPLTCQATDPHPPFELIPNSQSCSFAYCTRPTKPASCRVMVNGCDDFVFVFTVKPKITYIVNQSTSEMAEQVTLTCEASGDPTPTISWSYGERVFTEGEQVK